MPKNFIQEIARTVTENLPDGMKDAPAEIDRLVREGVEKGLSNFRYVKMEEFEIQQKILLKTRKKVDELESKLAKIESKLQLLLDDAGED